MTAVVEVTAAKVAPVAALADTASPDHDLRDIHYLRPIPYPEKTIGVGVNYVNRNSLRNTVTDE